MCSLYEFEQANNKIELVRLSNEKQRSEGKWLLMFILILMGIVARQ